MVICKNYKKLRKNKLVRFWGCVEKNRENNYYLALSKRINYSGIELKHVSTRRNGTFWDQQSKTFFKDLIWQPKKYLIQLYLLDFSKYFFCTKINTRNMFDPKTSQHTFFRHTRHESLLFQNIFDRALKRTIVLFFSVCLWRVMTKIFSLIDLINGFVPRKKKNKKQKRTDLNIFCKRRK